MNRSIENTIIWQRTYPQGPRNFVRPIYSQHTTTTRLPIMNKITEQNNTNINWKTVQPQKPRKLVATTVRSQEPRKLVTTNCNLTEFKLFSPKLGVKHQLSMNEMVLINDFGQHEFEQQIKKALPDFENILPPCRKSKFLPPLIPLPSLPYTSAESDQK